LLIISQIQSIANNINRLLGKVKVTDGTNDMPTLDAASRAGFVKVTDGTRTPECRGPKTAINNEPCLRVVAGMQAGLLSTGDFSALVCSTANRNLFVGLRHGATEMKLPTAGADVQGASPQTLLAAAGASTYNRIHSMTISTDTAGLITVSDGICRVYAAINTPVNIIFTNGKKQTTSNTAITVTNAGGGNVAAECVYNTEA